MFADSSKKRFFSCLLCLVGKEYLRICDAYRHIFRLDKIIVTSFISVSAVQIHKKRRIVGRVRCKNIKTECPKPTCPDPILLPGRCCKVCPGQDDSE